MVSKKEENGISRANSAPAPKVDDERIGAPVSPEKPKLNKKVPFFLNYGGSKWMMAKAVTAGAIGIGFIGLLAYAAFFDNSKGMSLEEYLGPKTERGQLISNPDKTTPRLAAAREDSLKRYQETLRRRSATAAETKGLTADEKEFKYRAEAAADPSKISYKDTTTVPLASLLKPLGVISLSGGRLGVGKAVDASDLPKSFHQEFDVLVEKGMIANAKPSSYSNADMMRDAEKILREQGGASAKVAHQTVQNHENALSSYYRKHMKNGGETPEYVVSFDRKGQYAILTQVTHNTVNGKPVPHYSSAVMIRNGVVTASDTNQKPSTPEQRVRKRMNGPSL